MLTLIVEMIEPEESKRCDINALINYMKDEFTKKSYISQVLVESEDFR